MRDHFDNALMVTSRVAKGGSEGIGFRECVT